MTLTLHSWGDIKNAKNLPVIFCIHGWASNAQVFKPIAELFSEHFHFVAVDLPGFGTSPCSNAEADYEINKLISTLLDVAPKNATWLGWSLGGMLAVQAAARAPDQIKRVITICSNAQFVASKQWKQGVPSPLFNGFMETIDDVKTTLRRFAALTVVGEQKDMLQSLKWLQQNTQSLSTSSSVLKASLQLLSQIDNRKLLGLLPQPCMHVLATDDAIVPNKLSQELNKLNPMHLVSFVPNASHACLVTQPQSVANGILTFMQAGK
ncbi:MAG: pimeloyl-ACP methyl ester esterase [Crocinitomicaceae bacterium]|jgi:pimeloyl-ACP methyl ester esterase